MRVVEPQGVTVRKAMYEDGSALLKSFEGALPEDRDLLAIHRAMLTTRLMDARMMNLQRQGRVGFVGSAMGQEGAIHASAQVFGADDWIFSALREGGVTLQRGMAMDDYVAHMFGNAEDSAKGRQMPNHFQCKEANFPTWSSVLGTQLPHAVGAAMAMQGRGEKNVVAAYTGDGATSTSGFHSAMNFAGVFKAPVVFLVIDNGWAISLPSSKQTAAKSYGDKALAYGMPGQNIDGMDVFAVYAAVAEARQRALDGKGPSLLNLRCYRQGGHSSSDDPSRYRNQKEVEYWAKRDPLARIENYLFKHDLLKESELEQMNQSLTEQISASIKHAETVGPPPLESLVEDVFATPPMHLRRQVADALRIVAEKGDVDRLVGKFPL